MNNNSSTDTYKNAGGLSANDKIDGNIRDLKIKFDIGNIPIENYRLPDMYWMLKMYKKAVKARFIIASPKSSIKPLARATTSVFRLFFRQMQTYNDKCRFFTDVTTFWVIENKNITVNNYRAPWVKNIKDNVICINKEQIKDAVAYLLLNCYFIVGPKIFC